MRPAHPPFFVVLDHSAVTAHVGADALVRPAEQSSARCYLTSQMEDQSCAKEIAAMADSEFCGMPLLGAQPTREKIMQTR
jgi:hypothetical protein